MGSSQDSGFVLASVSHDVVVLLSKDCTYCHIIADDGVSGSSMVMCEHNDEQQYRDC